MRGVRVPTLRRAAEPRPQTAASGIPAAAVSPSRPARLRIRYAALAGAARRLAERTRPVWSPVTRVLGWVSPLGWGVVALGLLASWAGARWGWSELTMIGAAALVLFLACAALALGRTRVRIEAEVEPDRVTVGDPATGRIRVANLAKTPMLPILVELPVGRSAARFTLPPLVAGAEHDELFVVPTHRRGVIPVGPARTVQGDPLGLVRRTVQWTEVTELFVHPRITALEPLGAGLLRDLEGSVTEDQSMSDLAFHALREYQPGDDRRYIHWRSSAKADRLLVRQFLDTRRSHVAVLVDVDPAVYLDGQQAAGELREIREITASRTIPVPGRALPELRDLETAISVAGSVALRAQRDEQDATIVAGPHIVTTSTPQRTLDTLARVEPASHPLRDTATTAVAVAPDASVALIVTGPLRDFVDLQRAANQFGPEVRTVVVVVDPTAERSIRHAGGLTLLTIDGLRHLRAAFAAGVSG